MTVRSEGQLTENLCEKDSSRKQKSLSHFFKKNQGKNLAWEQKEAAGMVEIATQGRNKGTLTQQEDNSVGPLGGRTIIGEGQDCGTGLDGNRARPWGKA